jgi:site-specific recombinase XerD
VYEFEKLIGRVEWIRRYTTGPFLEERNAFLLYLRDLGYSARQLRTNNKYMLWIAELIDLRQPSAVTPAQVERAANKWVATHCRARSSANTVRIAKGAFKQVAKNWFRFLDRWCSDLPCSRYLPQIDSFLQHLREDRGYTVATVLTRESALRLFFNWLALKECALEDVVPTTIADYFVKHRSKNWTRITIAGYTNSLRSFFSYASAQGWCKHDIRETIERPRLYSLSGIPQGPTWREVRQLITSVSSDRPGHIRDRAVILLLAVYGLRCGEVASLTLDDIDWGSDRIRIHRLKRRTPQTFPLTAEVGNAILRYIREVRPKSTYRQVFLRLFSPHRPFGISGLNASIAIRIRALGLQLPTYGPHGLRHACATHLLSEGFSIKEIGDHLGHRSAQATQIYAKVDELGLRKVAAFDLKPLKVYVANAFLSSTPEWVENRLPALRQVADVHLGGLL